MSLFAGYEPIERTLAGIRATFTAALAGTGEGEAGNGLTVDGIDLRVDQVRGIANTPGDLENWTERDGQLMIRNDTRRARFFLSYVVGANRYLSAADFEHILTRVCAAERSPLGEPDVAQFVNLVAAEPQHDPRSELAVWATVASKLATGSERDYFAGDIPGLVTSFDPLHEEIEPGAEFAAALLPASAHPLEPTLEGYTARLATEAGADLAAHVHRHVLDRVLQALS